MRRLLAVAFVVAVSSGANETTTSPSPPTPADVRGPAFLTDVIRRIDSDRRVVAKPVQDLQVALDRIAELFGPETRLEDAGVTFDELPENNDILSTSATPSLFNGVSPTAPTATASAVTTSLTPQELQALYQLAAQKGLALDLTAIQGGYVPPSNAKPSEDAAPSVGISAPTPLPPTASTGGSSGSTSDSADGYYYYFVPIKDLKSQILQQHAIKGQMIMGQQTGSPENTESGNMESSGGNEMANMAASAALMAGGADRAVEPLFMAMAGFVGMALMFVASVLFLPKLGALRSLKHAPDEVASVSKLVMQSIEGKDCSERLTCEIGRAARAMKLSGKPLRVLELILPPPMSHQVSRIRRAVARKEKCNFIPCKYRRPMKLPMDNHLPKKTIRLTVKTSRPSKPDKTLAKPQPTTPSIFGTSPAPEQKSFTSQHRSSQQRKSPKNSQRREPRS